MSAAAITKGRPGPAAVQPATGMVRPLEYGLVKGRLVVHGMRATDVEQRMGTSTCHLDSTMSSFAQRRPKELRALFTPHPDGTISVRLHRPVVDPETHVETFVPITVSIDRRLPMLPGTQTPAFTRGHDAEARELWPSFLQKAPK